MKIRKGDTVRIIAGKDKGKTGKVIKIDVKDSAAVVEGLNLFKKHQKPKRQGEKGEVVSVPRPLNVSKIMLVCPSCGETAKIGHRFENGSKVRYCKKCKNSA